MDIAEFLTARYGEDEAAALVASNSGSGSQWSKGGETAGHRLQLHGSNGFSTSLVAEFPCEVDFRHAVRHDPARVLAEVAAKRRVVDAHSNVNDGDCGTCVRGGWGYPTHGGSTIERWPCPTLRALAMPYADHPDYDPAWRVDD